VLVPSPACRTEDGQTRSGAGAAVPFALARQIRLAPGLPGLPGLLQGQIELGNDKVIRYAL
jgi:hypothetical protein